MNKRIRIGAAEISRDLYCWNLIFLEDFKKAPYCVTSFQSGAELTQKMSDSVKFNDVVDDLEKCLAEFSLDEFLQKGLGRRTIENGAVEFEIESHVSNSGPVWMMNANSRLGDNVIFRDSVLASSYVLKGDGEDELRKSYGDFVEAARMKALGQQTRFKQFLEDLEKVCAEFEIPFRNPYKIKAEKEARRKSRKGFLSWLSSIFS